MGDHLINLKATEIGINGTYASVLGLKEDEFVTFIEYNDAPKALCLDVSPCNKNDFEILVNISKKIFPNNCL